MTQSGKNYKHRLLMMAKNSLDINHEDKHITSLDSRICYFFVSTEYITKSVFVATFVYNSCAR